MKFLIETDINNNVVHDFSFELIKAIDFQNWLNYNLEYDLIEFKYLNDRKIIQNGLLKNLFVPVGSVEFVLHYIRVYYPHVQIKPKNVPELLFEFAGRKIYNVDANDVVLSELNYHFIKSNDVIKSQINGHAKYITQHLPDGNYQVSEIVTILSEWRCFVYSNKLVGLQNYLGDFTLFPNVELINQMIEKYKTEAPIAYTLDVGVDE
ncbi:MAG: ATP-grasp domain-containing protein, partial [bacterium]